MPEFAEKPKKHFPLITRIFLVLYLFIFLAAVGLALFYQQVPLLTSLDLAQEIIAVPTGILAIYSLLIAFSFWRAGDNWLIFSIILIFFSSLGALLLGGIGILNGRALLDNGLPSCINDIAACNASDGIILLSAILLGVAVPTLVLNIVTFVAILKSFGARDPYA